MNDDRAFLARLVANPKDDAPRLVYADWLDERGDPRGEYLRLVNDLATNSDAVRRRRLNTVRPTLSREWLGVAEQPALLRANPTPYPANWPGFGLGDLRPVDATYGGNVYASLPAVPLDWLVRFDEWFRRMAYVLPFPGPTDEDEDEDHAALRAIREEGLETAVPRLSAAAKDFGLRLPDQFAAFIGLRGHPYFFQSVTACDFNLPERIEPAPKCPEAGLLRFYSDQQGCLHWYLYLTLEGDECVVASSAYLGGSWEMRRAAELDAYPYREESDDASKAEFWFCAPSFAGFVVRVWIENVAWHSIHQESAWERETIAMRMPEVQSYLDHYRSGR